MLLLLEAAVIVNVHELPDPLTVHPPAITVALCTVARHKGVFAKVAVTLTVQEVVDIAQEPPSMPVDFCTRPFLIDTAPLPSTSWPPLPPLLSMDIATDVPVTA